jgi:phenylalanyl-tRNA synthetase beta chain
MLLSLNWIKDFVTLPNLNIDEIAYDFTMATAEVEDIIEKNKHLSQIKIAKIISIRKHPEADKLNLVTVNYQAGDNKEVVCGASNVREGLIIAYAPVGVTLPNGLLLEPKKIRGVLSEGMICSKEELGFEESSEGIWELPQNTSLYQTLESFLDTSSDTLFDIDNKSLTHRPDLWGHYGMAREFSALYNTPLKNIFTSEWQKKIESKFSKDQNPISINVFENSSCLAYHGISIDNIAVQASPTWMQTRLINAGLRPINSIVDISNYVMLELGIPLHIFDRNKISGNQLNIKALTNNETFKTLDEVSRNLIATDTVICDQDKPLVLAGIMGGENSSVDNHTQNIFIEVANWKAHEVRKTSTRLGLRTDSSQRYEKSLDSQSCYQTMLRTIELILELNPNAKIIGSVSSDGADLKTVFSPLKITTSVNHIENVLGKKLGEEKIISIFTSLGFLIQKNQNELIVTIPSYRSTKDIEQEADLIEEIGRIIGFDNIEEQAPLTAVRPVSLSPAKKLHRKISDYLQYNNYLEIMTHPLVGEELLNECVWLTKNEELVLVNALSIESNRMRPTLVASAINAASKNTKNYSRFNFFEIGRSYLSDKTHFKVENNQLLVALFDKNQNRYMELMNTVENILNLMNLSYQFITGEQKFPNTVIPHNWKGNHPHEYTHVKIMGKLLGAVTTVHPLVLKNFKIKGNLHIAVIDLASFEEKEIASKNNYQPLSKFPSSIFDLAVLAKQDEPIENILQSLKKIKAPELTSSKIRSVYDLGENKKSVTLTNTFASADRTLTPEEIKTLENKIISTLEQDGYPLKC